LKDRTISRRRLLKGAALLGSVVAVAKSYDSLAASPKLESDGPLGAWFITVTPHLPPGAKPRRLGRAMTVINAGGTVVETDLGYLKSSPGMGAWVRTGKYTFEYTLFKQSVNPDGSYARTEQIHQKNVLNETFDKFSGDSFVTILDASGKVVNRVTAKIAATRIKVDSTIYPS